MSWKFANHSIRMVIRNFDDAVRLTLVPFLLYSFITATLSQVFTGTWNWGGNGFGSMSVELNGSSGVATALDAIGLVGALINIAIYLPMAAWLAIAWHRFVLAEEYPTGYLPAWNKDRILRYVGKMITLFGLYLVVLLGAAVILLAVGSVSPALSVVATIVFLLAVVSLTLRVSTILPAASVDNQGYGVAAALEQTKPYSWAIFGMFWVYLLYIVPIVIVVGILVGLIPVLNLPMTVLLEYVFLLVGISALTTIYGVAVEGRELT